MFDYFQLVVYLPVNYWSIYYLAAGLEAAENFTALKMFKLVLSNYLLFVACADIIFSLALFSKRLNQ